MRAREETLVKDEARHQRLKEESKKQVIAFGILLHASPVCMLPTDCHLHGVRYKVHSMVMGTTLPSMMFRAPCSASCSVQLTQHHVQ